MKNSLDSSRNIICDTCCYAQVRGGDYFYCNICRDWLERNSLKRDNECDHYKESRFNIGLK